MARDDSLLSTGLSSASSRKLAEKMRREQQLKQSQRAKLTPAGDLVVAWIDREYAEITDRIANLPIDMATSEESVKCALLAYQMHRVYLENLKSKAKNLLRTLPQEEPRNE